MRSKCLVIASTVMLLHATAQAYVWSSAIPTQVQLVDGGLVLLGDFDNSGVACATGPKAIYLPSSDPKFREKLGVALLAFATESRIEVLIADPIETNCIQVSAIGYVPVAYHNFWTLK